MTGPDSIISAALALEPASPSDSAAPRCSPSWCSGGFDCGGGGGAGGGQGAACIAAGPAGAGGSPPGVLDGLCDTGCPAGRAPGAAPCGCCGKGPGPCAGFLPLAAARASRSSCICSARASASSLLVSAPLPRGTGPDAARCCCGLSELRPSKAGDGCRCCSSLLYSCL